MQTWTIDRNSVRDAISGIRFDLSDNLDMQSGLKVSDEVIEEIISLIAADAINSWNYIFI